MKENTNLSLLFLSYIAISGALYHLTFWETFDLNGLALINITDIVKSAFFSVFPLIISITYYLFLNSISFQSDGTAEGRVVSSGSFLSYRISNFGLLIILIVFQFLIILVFDHFELYYPFIYFLQGTVYFIAIIKYLIDNEIFNSYFIKETNRRITIYFIVALPVISYFSGKYDSAEIYQNLKYKYTLNISEPPNLVQSIDTLKFLGITDKNYIFTDLKNSKIILLKSDNVNTLTLFQKKK